jgi:hypothetical protein
MDGEGSEWGPFGGWDEIRLFQFPSVPLCERKRDGEGFDPLKLEHSGLRDFRAGHEFI